MDEKTIASITMLVICLSFLGYIFYFIFSLIADEIRATRDKIILAFGGTFDASLREHYEKIFAGRLTYYERLPDDLKLKFILRVRNFVRVKTFESRQDMVITEEIKVMIAAAAVQLTFGLKNYVLDYFSKIIVYPESYYSPITERYHRGEANPSGIIVVSWKDFLEGYAIADDTYNVGLHEMAHALELEERLGGSFDSYFAAYYEKWQQLAEEQYQAVHEKKDSYFRKYAGVNRHEFFAVCIEHFFESSEAFRMKLPEMYHQLSILLNQDPLNKDTQISRFTHKTGTEMLSEARSSTELFVTQPFYKKLLFIPAIFIVASAWAKLAKADFFPLLFSYTIFSVLLIVFVFARIKRIVLYEKYLGIKNHSGKLIAVYPFEDIVSVKLEQDRRSNSILILVVSDGRLYRNSYGYSSSDAQDNQLLQLLKEKNIVVHFIGTQ